MRAAGYDYAYSTCFHRDPEHRELTIPRRVFWERTLQGVSGRVSTAVASCLVRGVFDRRSGCPHDHGIAPAQASGSRVNPSDPHPPRSKPPGTPPVGEPVRS